MKIANIVLTSQNGGVEQVFLDYCKVLQDLNHEVVAIVKPDAPYAYLAAELGVKLERIKNKFGYYDPLAIKKIATVLKQNDCDVVFAHAGRAMVLARKAIKKIKNKTVFLISINHSNNVKRSIGADIVLSVNKEILYKTIDAGQRPERSFVISNAIDVSDVELPAQRYLSRKKKITIGALGRFDDTKGFDLLIEALKIANKKSKKEILLKLAGSGVEENNLRQLVADLKLADKVEFCGWIADKKKFFSEIDIFCIPSRTETFGIVILEAMKYGKPIISSNSDGAKEILRNEVDALIVDGKDDRQVVQKIAEAILNLSQDSTLANSLVKSAFARLQNNFSFEMLKKCLQEILPDKL